jgi:hypothetical protein
MKCPNLIFAVTVCVLTSLSALAINGEAKLERIEPTAEGYIKLSFKIALNRLRTVSLIDDDGVATLATIAYTLLEKPEEELHSKRKSWNDLKNKPVEDWVSVFPLIQKLIPTIEKAYHESLARVPELEKENAGDAETLAKIKELKGLYDLGLTQLTRIKEEVVSKHSETAPSYELFNNTIGEFLNRHAGWHRGKGHHTYTTIEKIGMETITTEDVVLNQPDTGNPISYVLMGILGFKLSEGRLGTKLMLEADFKTLIPAYLENVRK